MSQEPKRDGIWEEGDLASSEALYATAVGLGNSAEDLQIFRDAVLIAAMFDFNGLTRGIHILSQVGGLGYLLTMHTPDLLMLGLSPAEAGRFECLPDLASHILCFRSKLGDQSTRRDLANELTFRGVQAGFDQETFGIIGWCAEGRRVMDRALPFLTFGRGAKTDVSQMAKMALRAGAKAVTFWRWSPANQITVTVQDVAYADELRMVFGSVLQTTVSDYLILCPSESISMAVLQQWTQ